MLRDVTARALPRRDVIRLLGLTVAGGALAACTSDSAPKPSPSASPSSSASSTSTTAPTSSSPVPGTPTSSLGSSGPSRPDYRRLARHLTGTVAHRPLHGQIPEHEHALHDADDLALRGAVGQEPLDRRIHDRTILRQLAQLALVIGDAGEKEPNQAVHLTSFTTSAGSRSRWLR